MDMEHNDKMELTWEGNIAWTNDNNMPWTEYDQIYPMNLKSKKEKKKVVVLNLRRRVEFR